MLVRKMSQPALIWLDHHLCGGDILVTGKEEECLVLEEIAAIDTGNSAPEIAQHLILIDDPQYVLNRLLPPHQHEH